MAIWAEAGPITGTMAAEYLRRRRLDPDLVGDDVVRFHPRCPRGASEKLPALIWLFTHIITLKPCGVLRVYLIQHQDGAVTKIEDGAAKLSLGRTAGAVVRLSPDDEVERGLGVAEGTETALAILSAGWHPIWATGGTAGLTAFPVLDGIEVLTIFSDADPPGRRAAETCAKRWAEAGREVAIFEPHTEGTDFNDTIREVAA
ncbi:MAG: hypothetical protein FJX57_05715 [Alphaproteobacteria bacterium]|nr:hypothetical protein [Alphaproteobacteria bacterium]